MIKNLDLPCMLRFQLLNNLAKERHHTMRQKQHKYSGFVSVGIYLFMGILQLSVTSISKKGHSMSFFVSNLHDND